MDRSSTPLPLDRLGSLLSQLGPASDRTWVGLACSPPTVVTGIHVTVTAPIPASNSRYPLPLPHCVRCLTVYGDCRDLG